MAVMSTSSPRPMWRAAIGLRHEVDRLRGAAHKDDLARVARVDEALNGGPRGFVLLRGAFARASARRDGCWHSGARNSRRSPRSPPRGFCEVAALSRYTSGRPWTCCAEDREIGANSLHIEAADGLAHRLCAASARQLLEHVIRPPPSSVRGLPCHRPSVSSVALATLSSRSVDQRIRHRREQALPSCGPCIRSRMPPAAGGALPARRCRASADKTAQFSSIWPMVAPCVHFTSSA